MIKETYHSETTGVDRNCWVYLPPGYDAETACNILYVLHGIGGTEDEWINHGTPKEILDTLVAAKAAEPMILVFPNGRAMNPDSVPADIFSPDSLAAFARFEDDLINDLIPFIEGKYKVYGDRDHRGICGLSMGGGQSLNFGVSHPELFSCVGAFSPAPNTDMNSFAIDTGTDIPLIWILCGESDDLLYVSGNVSEFLDSRGVSHTYRTMPGGHDWPVWKEGLRSFVQLIFK